MLQDITKEKADRDRFPERGCGDKRQAVWGSPHHTTPAIADLIRFRESLGLDRVNERHAIGSDSCGEAQRANGQEKYFFTYRGKDLHRTAGGFTLRQLRMRSSSSPAIHRSATVPGYQGRSPASPISGRVLVRSAVYIRYACRTRRPPLCHGMRYALHQAGVVSYLFETIGDHDAAIPLWSNEMIEPLHAVYRRSALLDYLMSHDSLSLRPMIRSLNARYIPVDELRAFDPHLKTFTNINKLEELEHINHSPSGKY